MEKTRGRYYKEDEMTYPACTADRQPRWRLVCPVSPPILSQPGQPRSHRRYRSRSHWLPGASLGDQDDYRDSRSEYLELETSS